jgi:hypothetical protein
LLTLHYQDENKMAGRGRWKKGVSGNPRGRPKGAFRKLLPPKVASYKSLVELRELAAQHAPRAIEELASIAFSTRNAMVRIRALAELLSWAYPKPTADQKLLLAPGAPQAHSIEVRFLGPEAEPEPEPADIGRRIEMDKDERGRWRLISRD